MVRDDMVSQVLFMYPLQDRKSSVVGYLIVKCQLWQKFFIDDGQLLLLLLLRLRLLRLRLHVHL